MTLVFFLFACSGGGAVDSGAADDSAADTDTAPACATVNPGSDWAWAGQCPQMTTPVAITVESCTLTLDYESVGGMTMGMPYGGTIVDDAVTFSDGDTVTGCVGTVETADKITGSCADGCTFRLTR